MSVLDQPGKGGTMSSKLRVGAASAVLLALAGVAPLSAQVISDPAAIRACLCDEVHMTTLADAMHQQQRSYDEQRLALQQLDEAVRTRRAQIDVYNPAEIDAFKQLLSQRDQADDDFAGPATQNYTEAVSRYNQSVAAYNANCAGRSYESTQLSQARQNLDCPKP
jgi:hypothetical protein